MKVISLRLSPTDEANAEKIFSYYGAVGECYSEQFRDFLSKCSTQLESYHKSEAVKQGEENATPIYCKLRISKVTEEGQKFYCVNQPPKAQLLIDLQVCKVCCAIRYNLKLREETKIGEMSSEKSSALFHSTEETAPTPPKPKYTPIHGWNTFPIRADGARVCPYGGAYVYQGNCQNCKRDEREKWDACVTLHYQNQNKPSQMMPSQKTT